MLQICHDHLVRKLGQVQDLGRYLLDQHSFSESRASGGKYAPVGTYADTTGSQDGQVTEQRRVDQGAELREESADISTMGFFHRTVGSLRQWVWQGGVMAMGVAVAD